MCFIIAKNEATHQYFRPIVFCFIVDVVSCDWFVPRNDIIKTSNLTLYHNSLAPIAMESFFMKVVFIFLVYKKRPKEALLSTLENNTK
jgi:hypothetical protein